MKHEETTSVLVLNAEEDVLVIDTEVTHVTNGSVCQVSGCYCQAYTRGNSDGVCGDCGHYARDHG